MVIPQLAIFARIAMKCRSGTANQRASRPGCDWVKVKPSQQIC